jgi:adenine-specific DNA methylase
MKFEGVKCDECGRIQGEVNHWIQMRVWESTNRTEAVMVGPAVDETWSIGLHESGVPVPATAATVDLCGQGCAFKHIAKLLGWNIPFAG